MMSPAASIIFASFLLATALVPTALAQAVSIDLQAPPTSVAPGGKITLNWEVKGSGKIAHTALHWDTKPGNPADFKSYPKATPDFASLNPAQDAPKKYTVTVDAPTSGTIYYVVHAIVDGKNVYVAGGERTITVSAAPGAPQPQAPAPAPAPAGAGVYGAGIDTTLVLGIVAVIIVVAVVAVALRRRKPKPA